MTLKEACGVIGAYDAHNPVADKIFYGLEALQHRGQESSGIAVMEGIGKVYLKRAMGLAGEGLSVDELSALTGRSGIGHVRYSTLGKSGLVEAQPYSYDGLAFSYNGNMVNYVELRDDFARRRVRLTTTCDAEIILKLIVEKYRATGDLYEALSEMSSRVEGAYSATILTDKGEVVAFRDPNGFKPLCYGTVSSTYMFSSESVALDMCGGHLLADVQPGEALLVSEGEIRRENFAPCRRRAHCMFEYVYFSRPDSVIEGRSVYHTRLRLGASLAKKFDREADIIIPVPDTSRPAAEGLCRQTGIPVAEGLIKNRYIHRTFIMPRDAGRDAAVRVKLNPLKAVIENQRIILIDDSIVRGTTIRNIVHTIKRAGAKEVHVRITCPPIISPCFYGIDIATHDELIACKHSVEENARLIGADSLEYQSLDGLIDAIGISREELCLACLTGRYPTPKAQRLADAMKEKPPTQEGTRYIELGLAI